MSHNVEKMMFTGKRPWWYGNSAQEGAVGVDLGEDAVTSERAMNAAGLNFRVELATAGFRLEKPPITTPAPFALRPAPAPKWTGVENDRYLVRSDTGTTLGHCSKGYVPFQNAEGFEFLDSLVETGDLLYHTAGSLEGGKRVWILAQTPTSWTIKRKSGAENTHHAFLLAMLGHTGDVGINLMATDVRAECANTCGFADTRAEGENLIFRIPHRGNIRAKLDLAAVAIETMADQSAERREVLQALAQTAMNTDDFLDFATSIFLGLDGDEKEIEEAVAKFYADGTDREKTIMENKVAKVAECFLVGQGNEGDSAYDALQGFTEFFDHFDLDHIKNKIARGKRAAKVVSSSWVGAGAERKSLVYKRLATRLNA